VQCRRILLGRAKFFFLLHIAKGKKGRAAVLRLSEAKSGAQKGNTHSHTRATEVWALGAVVYTMMTGMPPPHFYNYEWQISRMNDKGFGKGIQDIVARMLEPHPKNRIHTKDLVNRVDDGWEGRRATTEEGAHYVDVLDEKVERAALGTGGSILRR
jgi:serine/threonine protein kinase